MVIKYINKDIVKIKKSVVENLEILFTFDLRRVEKILQPTMKSVSLRNEYTLTSEKKLFYRLLLRGFLLQSVNNWLRYIADFGK